MKVSVREIIDGQEQVIIECIRITPDIEDIRCYVQAKGTTLSGTTDEQCSERFALEDVYYFEALDEKVFAYTRDKAYLVKARLYELEQAYLACHFVRCSKSVVLNLLLLDRISPALNGRYFAHMRNGEKLIISRQYAPVLKQTIFGSQD